MINLFSPQLVKKALKYWYLSILGLYDLGSKADDREDELEEPEKEKYSRGMDAFPKCPVGVYCS